MTVTITPAKIDARIAELSLEAQRAGYAIKRAIDAIHLTAGDTRSVRNGWKMADDAARLTLPAASLLRFTKDEIAARTERARILGEIDALDTIYRAHGWTRYYFCTNTNGHIHSDERACPTLRPTTQMQWRPELSGLTGAEVVARHGAALCSVCYPDAPAEHTSSNLTAEERKARQPGLDARKAEIAEKKARTQLTAGETFRTRHNSERIETVAACQKVIRDAIDQEVEVEFFSGRTFAQSGWKNENDYTQFLANIRRSLEEQVEDAGQAAKVLMERERRTPGYGMTMEAIAQLRDRKEKASRKSWAKNAA